jgi:serum/glucocorticoid-regulated kinase 2
VDSEGSSGESFDFIAP